MPYPEIIADTAAEGPAEDPDPHRRLILEIVHEAGAWDGFGRIDEIVAPAIAVVSAHPALKRHLPAEACLALADDAFMRRLNGQFRHLDRATNVLSFPVIAPTTGSRHTLGDIAIGLETVSREAAEQGLPAPEHFTHLVIHGLLHLMGYDHETDDEAGVMEALEIDILASLGIANPYREAGEP